MKGNNYINRSCTVNGVTAPAVVTVLLGWRALMHGLKWGWGSQMLKNDAATPHYHMLNSPETARRGSVVPPPSGWQGALPVCLTRAPGQPSRQGTSTVEPKSLRGTAEEPPRWPGSSAPHQATPGGDTGMRNPDFTPTPCYWLPQ